MGELWPVLLGALVAAAVIQLSSTRPRGPLLLMGCVLAGIAASIINGEAASHAWAMFFSMDALLVWVSGLATAAGIALLRRNKRGRMVGRSARRRSRCAGTPLS